MTRNMRCELCKDGDPSKLVEGLEVGGSVLKDTDGDCKSYRCGKSIYGQSKLSAELGVSIDAQVEAPGHGKTWLDGKTGSDKRYCKRKMCSIVTPEAQEGAKRMCAAKWMQEGGGEVKAVSPAAECVRLLRAPERVAGVKGEGMRAKRESEVLVQCNDYDTYSMADVDALPDHKVVLPKGEFNGIRAHYNIRTDPDLGLSWAALRRAACGCPECAKQLALPWKAGVDRAAQPRYARNKMCERWPSYEGANDWKICQLMPKTAAAAKGSRESMERVLTAMVARISLMIKEGEIAAFGTTDAETLGYYLVKWLSEPYTLQERTQGVAGMLEVGTTLVADAVYFNPVNGAPFWYTPSAGETTPVEIAHVLRTGLTLLPLNGANQLPKSLAKAAKTEAASKKAAKVDADDHEAIMEDAARRDRLEYADSESEDEPESEPESEPDSEPDSEPED